MSQGYPTYGGVGLTRESIPHVAEWALRGKVYHIRENVPHKCCQSSLMSSGCPTCGEVGLTRESVPHEGERTT